MAIASIRSRARACSRSGPSARGRNQAASPASTVPAGQRVTAATTAAVTRVAATRGMVASCRTRAGQLGQARARLGRGGAAQPGDDEDHAEAGQGAEDPGGRGAHAACHGPGRYPAAASSSMVAARTGTDGTARRSGPGAQTSLETTCRPSASVISRMLDTHRLPAGVPGELDHEVDRPGDQQAGVLQGQVLRRLGGVGGELHHRAA